VLEAPYEVADPKKWFELFRAEFIEAAKDKSTEIGIHYDKWRIQESEDFEPEWTDVMAVFLSKLARKMACYQEWRDVMLGGNVDYVWYLEHSLAKVVVIEHENNFRTIRENEIRNLLESKIPLRVLLTYVYVPPKERARIRKESKKSNSEITQDCRDIILSDSREEIIERLVPQGSGELQLDVSTGNRFMIVIGGELEKYNEWWAYEFDFPARRWILIEV